MIQGASQTKDERACFELPTACGAQFLASRPQNQTVMYDAKRSFTLQPLIIRPLNNVLLE